MRMTGLDAVMAMSGGNPGAMRVCFEILRDGGEIDPDGLMGGLGVILLMDTFRIYEDRIWMLYKDVCREDVVSTLVVLRALQLGMIDQATLNRAIDNDGEGIDVPTLLAKVRERLPRFYAVAAGTAAGATP
jgi:hypothetical protein